MKNKSNEIRNLKFRGSGLKRSLLVLFLPLVMSWSVPGHGQGSGTGPAVPSILGITYACYGYFEEKAKEVNKLDYFYYHWGKLVQVAEKLDLLTTNSNGEQTINKKSEHFEVWHKGYSKIGSDKRSCQFVSPYMFGFSIGYDYATTGELGEFPPSM